MDVGSVINCTVISKEVINCNGTDYDLPEKVLTYNDTMFWVYIGIYVALVCFAGLMSGLTMGLLSLDITTLLTIRDGGTPKERKYASMILPIVKRHHLLLVTLLLANAGAVESMPIFLDKVSNPVVAVVISVTAVLIFGEVVPQAVCTRFGLAIGASLAPLVYVLMGLFFIISYPLAKLLDCCLGTEHGTFFRRAQLKALIDIHGEESNVEGTHARKDALSNDEVAIIKGALDMKNKTAKDAMMPIQKTFMLNMHDKMDHEVMSRMLEHGHSRVPVYCADRSNIISLLLTKTLIKLDPDDAIPVSRLIGDERYSRATLFIDADKPLFDLLNLFQTGRSHLAIVKQTEKRVSEERAVDHSDSTPLLVNETGEARDIEDEDITDGKLVGIITMEDVIEELLQEEIEDETDLQEISQKLHLSLAKKRKSGVRNSMRRCRSMPQQHSVYAAANLSPGTIEASQDSARCDVDEDQEAVGGRRWGSRTRGRRLKLDGYQSTGTTAVTWEEDAIGHNFLEEIEELGEECSFGSRGSPERSDSFESHKRHSPEQREDDSKD